MKHLLATDNAFQFMNTGMGKTAYWKQFLHEILAKVKQLGIWSNLIFDLVMCRPDIGFVVYAIDKRNQLGLTDKQLQNLSYQESYSFLMTTQFLFLDTVNRKYEFFSRN